MVAKKLSSHLKRLYDPQIDDRDGKDCFYCEKSFPSKVVNFITMSIDKNMEKEFDHLNNDDTDNRLENLVHAHRICNKHKMQNTSWIQKAKAKLRDNERSARIPVSHANTDKETATETDSNAIFCEIVLKELAYYLQPNGQVSARTEELMHKEFLDLVAGKAYKITGHASQNTMRRIVDMFCTKEYPYVKEKNDEKRFIIRLRREEEF